MGYRTPNIDRLAEGMRFTDSYGEQSQYSRGVRPSSPARASTARA